ncbi:MAG: organic solvent tolerance protein OstA, partial [Pirellula sp.]
RYWLQSDRIELNDQRESVNTGMLGFGSLAPSGDQTAMKAKARSNFVYVEGVPVFYWPVLNSNVESPSFYVSGFQTRQDTLFGTVAMVDWDLYQILGINALDGTRWGLSTDYLSKRGFAMGTNYNYNLPSLLGAGPTYGWLDAWGLSDRGLDTLGSDRKDMVPEATRRAKVFLQHRQLLTPDQEIWAEVGYITDRNFLEQYFENEWDTWKDRATALRYRHYFAEQQMLDFWGAVRTNAFFTETEWLPRADHYWLGKDVANVMTWYSHSQVGYAKLQKASFPTAPEDAAKWIYQPWEVPSSGIQAITRQELAMPVDLKYSKLTPYIAGEAAYWGEDLNGDSLGRLTGQAGVRSSTPFWNVFPDVQSSLLNLNGLAHKVSIEADTWYADSSKNLDQLPLYDPIDDNSQEHFRRRLIINTFGGTLPAQFESNNFAARQGMQRYVSAASSIIVADQMQSRMGLHQRWQTKRGVPGRERIADVVEFDVDGIYFYNPDRDNFGQTVGGINYAFRYHIGDRVTLLSDGYYDLFESGLHATTLGGSISRPGRGDMYLGFTTLDGPMTSDLLTAAFNYRLNDKWAAYGGTSYDFNVSGNRGQAIGITRIGESFLLRLGVNYDLSRDNTSFQFALEPRFLPSRGLGV